MHKKKSTYVVDLNKKLKLIHNKTIYFNNEQELDIDDPKDFIPINSYFNFQDDRMEFALKINNEKLNHLKIGKKTVHFKYASQPAISIHITLSEKKNDNKNEMCNIRIHANFKDHLLHLFQYYHKEFVLTIFYTTEDNKKYASSFSVPLPKIDDQTDWDTKKRFIPVNNPEDIGGFELKKLFTKRFSPKSSNASQQELQLLNTLLDYKDAYFEDRFEYFDFLKMFQLMVAIEDLDGLKEMRDYSLDFLNVYKYECCPITIRKDINKHLRRLMCEKKQKDYVDSIYVIQARKKLPIDIMEFDFVYIYDQQDYQQYHDDIEELETCKVTAKIAHIFDDLILFTLPRRRARKMHLKLEQDRPYHIEFIPNRTSIRIAQRALSDMIKMDMGFYLKNFKMPNTRPISQEKNITKFNWFNSTLTHNKEQQIAVENIVNRTSFPAPFILYGGPGTGKSTTIVEAIAQIVKLKPKSHILITASSNSTCDDIGNRLLKHISINKILRIYSTSFDLKPEKVDSVLQKVSNFRERRNCECQKRSCPEQNTHDDPTYEELSTARVVIATLVTAGRIVSSGFPSDHFDYIFIDEAGSSSEPDTYIPFGLGLSKKGVHAQIILSGDHKQLGPVVKNSFIKKLGYEVSLMERLMETDKKYQRIKNEYDYKYVVQLKQNYRNHPAIMKFSNENFYDSQLVSKCSEETKNFALDSDLLMFNKTFPLIFHTTRSMSKEVGTSLKNEGELIILIYYLDVILKKGLGGNKVEETDIGIIAPYRGQRDRMFEEISETYPKVEIGTVDSFQGREKKIILMSCVRSGTKHVGFLNNEKRLNVALTRAQSLLIIIGNATTLQKCSIWNKFIAYCYENKAMIGDMLSVPNGVIVDEAQAGTEELPEDGTQEEYDV